MESTPSPSLPDPLVGRVLAGGLRVLKRQGETNDGPLYQAEYSPAGPSVALVVLRAMAHPSAPSTASAPSNNRLQRLRRASRIRHPNVAGIREVGETPDGITYAVVEALAGDRLSEILGSKGTLPLWEAADLCLQAAGGLDAAHAAGIVHGTLSPHSLLVTHAPGGRALVKLIGFALGSPAAPARPIGRTLSGRYAAPERLAGHAPDERSDVFSLAAVLHHMLTGAPPARRPGRGSVPKSVRAVVRQALARAPAERFQTIADFAQALEHAVKNPSEAKRFLPRRTLVLGGAGALVVVAVGLRLARHVEQGADAAIRGGQESAAAAAAPAGPLNTDSAPPGAAGLAPRGPKPGLAQTSVPRRPEPRAPKSPSPRDKAQVKPGGSSDPPPMKTDSAARVVLSPFRRAHPWAATPTGRFYFRSSCPLALRSTDLLYFGSVEEARATGRSPSPEPGCS